MRIPTVQNMTSPRSGYPVANQYIISTDGTEVFQSYRTPIAKNVRGVFTISSNYNYSRTTSKYFTAWMSSFGLEEELPKIKRWLKKAKNGDEWLGSSRYNLKFVEELK